MSGEVRGYRHATSQSPTECVAHLSIHRQTQLQPQLHEVAGRDGSTEHELHAGGGGGGGCNVIRWSSVDRGQSATPSEGMQIQPVEVRCSRDGQGRVCTEHVHKMVADGDAYTLVILDCSPQMEGDYACDCHARCHCQTELIVKQQMDHVCQHVCQQHQQLAIEQRRSDSSQESELRQQQVQQQQQQQRQPTPRNYQYQQHQQVQQQSQQQQLYQHQTQPDQDQYQQRQQQVYHNQQQHYQQQYHRQQQQQQQSPQPSQQQQVQQVQYSQLRQTSQERDRQRQNQQEPQLQQRQIQQQDQQPPPQTQQQQQQQEYSQQTPKGGTRIVKRWDWNQAQFVTQEVPDQPIQRMPRQTLQSQSPSTTDVWHQEILGPSTSAASQQQYDPSWLAYRVPDNESVQADPLYRDLMLELQRLEEGVSTVVEPPPVVEPETFQRPVFGQSITPESIEVKEYENVEFVCRLIPISDPTMKIEWTVNGRPLQESSRYTNEHEFGVVRLRIKRCEAEDSGIYQCKATNSLGEAISTASLRVHAKGNVQCETLHPAGLDAIRQLENPKPVDHVEEQIIQQPPKFLTHITDYLEKDEGESVHFECCLAPVDDPDLKTEWFFNGRPLVTGSRFHTIDDFGFIVLDIDWLFPRDTGEYVCRATNKYGTDITRTVLRVKPDKNIIMESQLENPVQTIDKLRQLEFPDVVNEAVVVEPDKPAHFVEQLRSGGNKRQFVEGDNVHFEARVGPATDGNLTVEWFHNDKPLISGHRFKPTFDFGHIQLDILYVYAEDSGVYKCVTRNATGMDVSQFEIRVAGKPSLVYQSQLPKEMVGGVQKITDMEAMWNRAPDPEEEEAPAERMAPQFVLKPKPYTAFEGSCARFCCRIVGNPRPRLTWVVNGQTVVTGSRYKLTYDGMYHLTIPKCQLADAGKVEVYARNQLGDCFCTTELQVKRKVDDYRGVLKNSPNPWYDEQSLKVYQRQRSQDLTDDEDFTTFQQRHPQLQIATEQQSTSPFANQVIGYMEPGTPDVNLLARTQSPLIEPGDLHPVVIDQQVVMAPAPSTIQRALNVKNAIKTPQKSFIQQQSDGSAPRRQLQQQHRNQLEQPATGAEHQQDLNSQQGRQDQHVQDKQHVFGLDLPRYSPKTSSDNEQHSQDFARSGVIRQQQQDHYQQLQHQQQQQDQHLNYQNRLREHDDQQRQLAGETPTQQQQHYHQLSSAQQQVFDPRLPPPSPESVVHGKEVHSHTHKQTQLERRANQEIKREIIEKEIFEQEHKGVTKENVVRGSSVERGSTPTDNSVQFQKEEVRKQQQQQRQVHFQDTQQVLIEDYMIPPEFIQKIQPCQAFDGDEARFECIYKGDPKPTITWYRESKMIKPSNLYNIVTDLNDDKSTLIIRRVALNSNAVYTVKAENAAGSAKSSANLVVEPHPLPDQSKGGVGRKVDASTFGQQPGSGAITTTSSSSSGGVTTFTTTTTSESSAVLLPGNGGGGEDSSASQSDSVSQKVVKSVKTRKLSADEMAALIRASPEGFIAPTFLHTIHDTTSRPGELARLDARLVGTQPMEVRWMKDNQRVRADRSHKMVLEGDFYTLLILECSQRDEGSYECIATNRVGEARCGARLIVSDGRLSATGAKTPELITQSYSSSSSSAAAAAAAASYSSSLSSEFQQHQDQGGQRTHFGVQKHQVSPMLSQYTPQATGYIGAHQQHQQRQEIPKLIKRLENQQVREGKSVTLRCQISSFPIAEVYWYKEGDKLIKPSKYFRIFKDNDETYCLRILETFPEDQGEYKCVAWAPNGQSHVETKAMISVIPNSPK